MRLHVLASSLPAFVLAIAFAQGCALAQGDDTERASTTPEEPGSPPPILRIPPARSCRDAPVGAWLPPTKLEVKAVGGTPASQPWVLPDALTILFVADDGTGKRRIHRATRASSDQPFGVASPMDVAGPGLDAQPLDFPTAVSAREVIFTIKGELWTATRSGDDGPLAARYYDDLALNTGIAGVGSGWPALSADGRSMVFARGPLFKWRLYEARRPDGAPGRAWSSVSELAELNDPSGASLTFCPVLSADGRTIWFTSASGAGAKVRVASRESTAPTSVFGATIEIPSLEGGLPCPRAITADGCELYLQSNRDGTDSLWVSRRLR